MSAARRFAASERNRNPRGGDFTRANYRQFLAAHPKLSGSRKEHARLNARDRIDAARAARRAALQELNAKGRAAAI